MNWWSIIWGIWALIVLGELRTIIRNQDAITKNQKRIYRKLSELS